MRAAVFRWSARIIGAIGALMWTLVFVGQAFVGPNEEDAGVVAFMLAVLVVMNIVSFLAALRYERWGGTAAIVAGAALSLFAIATAGHNHILAAIVSGGPFLTAGLLFVLASRPTDRPLVEGASANRIAPRGG